MTIGIKQVLATGRRLCQNSTPMLFFRRDRSPHRRARLFLCFCPLGANDAYKYLMVSTEDARAAVSRRQLPYFGRSTGCRTPKIETTDVSYRFWIHPPSWILSATGTNGTNQSKTCYLLGGGPEGTHCCGNCHEFFPERGMSRPRRRGRNYARIMAKRTSKREDGKWHFSRKQPAKSRKGTSETSEVVENKRRGRGGTGRRTSLRGWR
jgi:hypothetical protein